MRTKIIYRIQEALKKSLDETHNILQAIDLSLTVYFVLEIVFRISVLTPTVFFKEWYNMVIKLSTVSFTDLSKLNFVAVQIL